MWNGGARGQPAQRDTPPREKGRVAQRVWPRARTDETVSVYYVVLRSTRRIEMDGRRLPSSRCTWWLTHRVYKVAADKVAN